MQYRHFLYTNYGCDKDGTTYSTKGVRRSSFHHTGYKVISVRLHNKTKQLREHRFVYECVTGKPIPEGLVVNHKNGNKSDNRFDNLEVVTLSENTVHAFQSGLTTARVGELNGNSTINADTVRAIIREIMKGKSNKELSLEFQLDLKHISLLRNKKRWKFIFAEPEFLLYEITKSKHSAKLTYKQRSELIELLPFRTNAVLAELFQLSESTVSRYRTKYLNTQSSTTIPNGSTLEVNASGSGVQFNN